VYALPRFVILHCRRSEPNGDGAKSVPRRFAGEMLSLVDRDSNFVEPATLFLALQRRSSKDPAG